MTESYEPVIPLINDYAGDTRVVARRVVQFTLDVLLVQVVVLAISVGIGFAIRPFTGTFLLVLIVSLLWLWLSLLGWLSVTVAWPMIDGGRTPGMRWCGLRVVTLDGARPAMGAHVTRFALTVIDGFPFGLIGLVIMSNSKRQQRLGDLVARTLVVRDRRHSRRADHT